MDVTFSAPTAQDSAHLNKKRRFAPTSSLLSALSSTNGAVEGQTYDGSVLSQFGSRTPTSAEIEAELLQVGMRIRKSVADGYQTKAFTPRPFFNMHRLSPETQAALCASPLNRQPISTATFCGISLAALAHISSDSYEAPPVWSYSSNHKRGFEDDSDSDDQDFMPFTPKLGLEDDMMAIPVDYFSIDFDGVEDVSPMTQLGDHPQPHLNGRRMAMPKSRSRKQHPATSVQDNPFRTWQLPSQMNGTQWMGHKRITSCSMQAHDFAEAAFLQRREDIDMDCS